MSGAICHFHLERRLHLLMQQWDCPEGFSNISCVNSKTLGLLSLARKATGSSSSELSPTNSCMSEYSVIGTGAGGRKGKKGTLSAHDVKSFALGDLALVLGLGTGWDEFPMVSSHACSATGLQRSLFCTLCSDILHLGNHVALLSPLHKELSGLLYCSNGGV